MVIGKDSLVKVVRTNSVPIELLGAYGIVTCRAYEDKWLVEFKGRTGGTMALSCTVREEDLEVIGTVVRLEV